MKAYLVTWQKSDGNDCTVYDSVVMAESQDAALEAVDKAIQAAVPDAESDGEYLGYFFSCSDECGAECEGHGGTCLRAVEEYATEAEARKAMAPYHIAYEI